MLNARLMVTVVLAVGMQLPTSAAAGTPPRSVLNIYRGPAASEAPRRAMVVPFRESVGAEGAGRMSAAMVGSLLTAHGLEVLSVEATPGADGDRLRRAESLGADLVVLGAVTRWARREIETPDAWVSRRRQEVFVAGERRVESQVALTVRILHVPSGRLAYSAAAHWSAPWPGEPDEAAERLLEEALAGWLSAWSKPRASGR